MSLKEVWIVWEGPPSYGDPNYYYSNEWKIVSVHASEAGAAEALTQRRLVQSWEVKP